MKKTHRQYLDRAVRIAIDLRSSEKIISALSDVKCSNSITHTLIRDIVSDARFFSITENIDTFWRLYGSSCVMHFIDSISLEVWMDTELLTLAKEDFLNNWLIDNLEPMTEAQRAAKIAKINCESLPTDDDSATDSEDDDEVIGATDCTDYTDSSGDPFSSEIPQIKDYIESAGRCKGEEHKAEAEYLASIPPSLVRLAEIIGRSSTSISGGESRFRSSARCDIDGVSVGDDLNSLLPVELSLLATQDTQTLFYQRFAQKRLQIFSSKSHSSAKFAKHKYGPIYVCMDTSSSMAGSAERVAKMLALAICIVAQRRCRPVCLVNYSYTVKFFVLRNLSRQRKELLSFMARSYGGGNDEDMLFEFLFERLPQSKKYQKVLKDFEDADLLIISDFLWQYLGKKTDELINKNHSHGTCYYALSTSRSYYLANNNFISTCDATYLYERDSIKEINPAEYENET